MNKVYIAMPTLGSIDARMCTFLYGLCRDYHDIMIGHTVRVDIVTARNRLLREFLETDCTHLLFLDDDNIPEQSDCLGTLLKDDKDIVSAIVPSRLPDKNGSHRLCVFREVKLPTGQHYLSQYVKVPQGEPLLQIDGCGMGMVLIKREVVEKVCEKYSYPCEAREVCYYVQENGYVKDENIDPSLVGSEQLRYYRYVSEDLSFFEKARYLGYNIYCDTTVTCAHIGTPTMITVNSHIINGNRNLNYDTI